jgi:hypothetical protein
MGPVRPGEAKDGTREALQQPRMGPDSTHGGLGPKGEAEGSEGSLSLWDPTLLHQGLATLAAAEVYWQL